MTSLNVIGTVIALFFGFIFLRYTPGYIGLLGYALKNPILSDYKPKMIIVGWLITSIVCITAILWGLHLAGVI